MLLLKQFICDFYWSPLKLDGICKKCFEVILVSKSHQLGTRIADVGKPCAGLVKADSSSFHSSLM